MSLSQNPSPEDDNALVRAFQAGDRSAFDRLVLHHQDRVFTTCYRILGNYEDADDTAQETFVKAFRSLKRFRMESAFSTWLFRIAVNSCKNRLKSAEFRNRKMRVSIHPSGNPGGEVPGKELRAQNPGPDDFLERKQKARLIQRAVDALPHDQRAVIVLRDIQGFSYEEISNITGDPLGTIKSKISRARQRVRSRLIKVLNHE